MTRVTQGTGGDPGSEGSTGALAVHRLRVSLGVALTTGGSMQRWDPLLSPCLSSQDGGGGSVCFRAGGGYRL